MRWTRGGRSGNIEDRRGSRALGGGLGLGGMLLLLVLSLVFKQDFLSLVQTGTEPGPATEAPPANTTPEEERMVEFVSFVLDDAQSTWSQQLSASGSGYTAAKLVLFRDAVRSGCGTAQSAVGPFYCPLDQKVYIDLGFYEELGQRFGAPGDFAQAYVLAHEIGHHVQHLLGTDERVRRGQAERPDQRNELSVALELQADCYAGVWGHSTAQRNLLEAGDIEEGLGAAAAVGDDRLQRQTTGRVVPDSFTHGSSEQRAQWFRRGFDSGDPSACDTFSPAA
ncbi:MAG: zinc metallopeptidase [Gemmatimonadetes bacterium]|nr:zinc metallopeptidase [Gemmatimonadota bacterium]